MSHALFDSLPPAFPQRAAWGTASRLRAWQAEALDRYLATAPRDFLAVATPGAGKTTFALRIVVELLRTRVIERIIVVAPTEHLLSQWADAAARVGVSIDPGTRKRRSSQFDGIAVTYAAVAAQAFSFETRVRHFRTLVILDEIHHAGDALSWGDAVRRAFEPATRRLALTGTPFRSDANPIPFVRYDEDGDGLRSVADFSYGYAEALRDHVVRPVVFMAYGGHMRWRTKAGDDVAAGLSDLVTKDVTAAAWRTALDPKGEWIPAVLRAADTRLTEVRRHIPDAGGLVIASTKTVARAYARILQAITGTPPTLVLSDDLGSGRKIDAFAASRDRWMVAVRMVSEGVDIARLAVGVYATSTATPLFFAQAVGRFVRSRRRGELATVFLPTVPVLLAHAAVLERQRDHVLQRRSSDDVWAEEDAVLAAAERTRTEATELDGAFEAVSSEAQFDHAMFDGAQYGLTAEPAGDEEADYLGLPGLVDTEQVAVLLAERQRRQLARAARRDRRDDPEQALHRQLATARKELNTLVAQAARIHQTPHSHVHADLRRRAGGPALAQCSLEQVQARIVLVRAMVA